MGKSIGKKYLFNLLNINKYNQNLLDYAKQSATDALKTSSKGLNQKTAEANGELVGNKITNNVTRVSKNSHTVINERDKDIPKKTAKERYISRKKTERYWWSEINVTG